MPKSDAIDVDGILEQIGQFGRFQLKQYTLMVIPIFFNAFFLLNYVFTAGRLNYRCEIPGCDDGQNATYLPTWLNNTVPMKGSIPLKCERFPPISNSTYLNGSYCDASSFDRTETVACGNFIFENDEVTIVKDFNITCPHNDWKLTLVGTMNNVGQFVALPIAGYLSDRFGRRMILLLSVVGSSIFGLLRSFSTNYEMFLLMEFLDPAIGSTMYTTAFILAMELFGSKMRVTGNNIISIAFALGEALLGLLAMFFRDWRTLLHVLYIPGLLSLPLLWTTSESVPWLILKGRNEEAYNILQKAARMNGRTISTSALESFCPARDGSVNADEPKEVSFGSMLKEAFSNVGLLLRIVNCSFCWMVNGLIYYGLSLNSVSLAGDKYVNFILVSLIELPGFLIMQLSLDSIGRKITLSSTMLLCGVFCFASEFIPSDQFWPTLVMFLLSKMAVTISFSTLYIYTAEIFPTNLRQSLLSLCSMLGRIGSMIAPQSPLLAKLWTPLPMVTFGALGIISGLTILQFPETLNTQLPDTVEEAMSMGKEARRDNKADIEPLTE